jgi:hypothetical protein
MTSQDQEHQQFPSSSYQYQYQQSAGPFTRIDRTPRTKAKKRVTLKTTVLVHEIDANKAMSNEEKSELYYTKDDLILTNLEVKAICALSNQLPQPPSTSNCVDDQNNDSNCVLAVETDGFLRGLEYHIYPQRFRNKMLTRRALLKYQTHLQMKYPDITPDQKAKAMRTASEKLSAWSYLAAQETARLDSLRAYDGDYLIPLDDNPLMCSSPFPDIAVKPKRKGSFMEVRRVTPNDFSPPLPFKKAIAA